MKKFILGLWVLSFLALLLMGCSYDTNIEPITTCTLAVESVPSTNADPTEPTQSQEPFDEDSLIEAYCSGEWDGSFIANGTSCASISFGELYVDNSRAYRIPDMGLDKTTIWSSVIDSSDEGTWVKNKDIGTVELWYRGDRKERFSYVMNNFDPYYSTVSKWDSLFVVKYGASLKLLDSNGYTVAYFSDVIDRYIYDDGRLCFSTFQHENYEVDHFGNTTLLETTYVYFPRKQAKLTDDNSSIVKEMRDLYNNGWDGTFTFYNGHYISLRSNSSVLFGGSDQMWCDNQVVNHLLLPSGKYAPPSCNLKFGEMAYYLDGEHLVFYGDESVDEVDIPDGDAEFIDISDYDDTFLAVIIVHHESNELCTLVTVVDRTVSIIGDCLDASEAYGYLYYLDADNNAYCISNWYSDTAESTLFYKGAYACSPFSDECQGVIVSLEESNYDGYGYYVYSPYGID